LQKQGNKRKQSGKDKEQSREQRAEEQRSRGAEEQRSRGAEEQRAEERVLCFSFMFYVNVLLEVGLDVGI
jgi:hypothetical protein